MSIRVGVSLGSLRMDDLNPRRQKTEGQDARARFLSAEAIAERQKMQEQSRINAGRRKSSDMDSFFLEFTKHREAAVSQNVVKLAKVMEDSKAEHVLTTNGDAAADDQKKLDEKFDMTAASLEDLAILGEESALYAEKETPVPSSAEPKEQKAAPTKE